MANISHFTQTVNGVSTTYDIHDANAVPLAGTNALSGSIIPDTDNAYDLGSSSKAFRLVYASGIRLQSNASAIQTQSDIAHLEIHGGTGWHHGSMIFLMGKNEPNFPGYFQLHASNGTDGKVLQGAPSGTLTWNGQSIQTISDKRLKQQIAEIDDKLLDAWEDVELSQFKYNDAVDEKGDKARLHTGYVVQQIQKACKEHGVDISQYGLFCHEEYAEETEEVEVTQKDGTKTKERKVIREANEHYSLRYTEALIVECKYLRRCIERLEARLAQLENPEESQEKGADK